MKALSLTQPWATAIIIGMKQYETRSWSTSRRERIYIHAAKGFPRYAKEFAQREMALKRIPEQLPFGFLIGTAVIDSVLSTTVVTGNITPVERLYGDYSYGRFAWKLTDVQALVEPIPYKGSLGLFEVSL